MTNPSNSEILTKIVSRLTGDTALMAAVSNKVYNHVPQDTTTPFIRVRWDGVQEWDTKTSNGFDGHISVDIWTDHRGDKVALQLADMVYALYHNAEFLLTAGQSLLVRYILSDSFIEPDGLTHHTIMRFKHIATS